MSQVAALKSSGILSGQAPRGYGFDFAWCHEYLFPSSNGLDFCDQYWVLLVLTITIYITYTLCIRHFCQVNYRIYGHIRCVYTVLASPTQIKSSAAFYRCRNPPHPAFITLKSLPCTSYPRWVWFALCTGHEKEDAPHPVCLRSTQQKRRRRIQVRDHGLRGHQVWVQCACAWEPSAPVQHAAE